MSSDLVLDRVLTAARSSIGLTTTAVVGAVRPLDLDRFAEAVAGSTGADVTGAANALYLSAVLAWEAVLRSGTSCPTATHRTRSLGSMSPVCG